MNLLVTRALPLCWYKTDGTGVAFEDLTFKHGFPVVIKVELGFKPSQLKHCSLNLLSHL